MLPVDALQMDDSAFELALADLAEKELSHFQSEFRKLSFGKKTDSTLPDKKLTWISRKLYAIKKECAKREVKIKITAKIQRILANPEDGLQFDEVDFKEIVKYMKKDDFIHYSEQFEKKYEEVLNNRKNIFLMTNRQSLDLLRKNLKIIKRWDFIQFELNVMQQNSIVDSLN